MELMRVWVPVSARRLCVENCIRRLE
jgi:hypothetical protein